MAKVKITPTELHDIAVCQLLGTNEAIVLEYKCECGFNVKLYTQTKPERLTKCFKCQKKIEPIHTTNIYKQKSIKVKKK